MLPIPFASFIVFINGIWLPALVYNLLKKPKMSNFGIIVASIC